MRRPRWSIILAVPVLVGWSLPMSWRLKKADRLYREGKHSEAAEVYQDVYLQRPDDAAAGYNLGTAQYKADDHESAAATLRGAAVSADTTLSARAFYNLGNAQYRLGQWQEAAEAYRQSLLYDPDDADAKHNLELVLRKMQEARQQASQPSPQDQEQERPKEQQRDESGQEQRGQEEQPAPEQVGQDSLPQPMPQPARRDTMSQQDAERLLEAIAEEEMEALKEARNVPRVQEQPVGADW
jgi:Ca-activated chloride channel family protein